MHSVLRAGEIVLLADIGFSSLAAVSLISKLDYERRPLLPASLSAHGPAGMADYEAAA